MLQHILVLIILVIMPSGAFFQIKALKRSKDSKVKIRFYITGMIRLWAIVACILLISTPGDIFFFGRNVEFKGLALILFIVVLCYMILTSILPFFFYRNKDLLANMKQSFEKLSFLHPVTKLERSMFIAVAVTVGICEEIIFRAFLVNYAQNSLFDLSLLYSVLLVNLIFGLGHFTQGIPGIVNATITGLFMSCLFIISGSLLLPILLHILLDLKILHISRIASSPDRLRET